MAGAEDEQSAAILKQVEYYFSDANLKRDHFFQTAMSKDPEGFIPMDLLLKCNKLKQLTQDPAEVAAALGASEQVELSEDKSKVRKKGAVPALDEDVAARKRAGVSRSEELAAAIAEKAASAVTERIVYKLTGLPAGCRWTDIKDALKEVMDTQGRMHVSHEDGGTEAFLTAHKEGNAEAWAKAAESGDKLKVQDNVVAMALVSDPEALLGFWTAEFTKNPPELPKRPKTQQPKGEGSKKRKAASTVSVCGTEYDYNALKTRVSEISKNHTAELTELKADEASFMQAVLDMHPRAAEKKADMVGLAVGVNKAYPDTRCFFVMKAAGNEDFSYKKCIDTAFGVEPKKEPKK